MEIQVYRDRIMYLAGQLEETKFWQERALKEIEANAKSTATENSGPTAVVEG